MNQHTNKSQFFLNLRGLPFVLAWVLAISVLIAQLHTLEHAELSGGNNHNVCLYCILGSELDAADIPAIPESVALGFSPVLLTSTNYQHKPVYVLYAFEGRAPPSISSII